MTNQRNTVLYTGFSNDLIKRVQQHKEKVVEGFSQRYNLSKLVFYETVTDPLVGIQREKQIKGGSRQKKIELIEAMNSAWEDLYDKLF